MAFSFGKMNDPDATLFVQVSEITGSTERGAIVDLVKDLKTNNLWSKMKAVYPMVGGTATTHKWNLKDPRDVDAAFRLTFSGGWTHSSTGALPNGSTGYANTYLTPSTTLTANNLHLGFYSRTNSASTGDAIGADDNGTVASGRYVRFRIRYTSGGTVDAGQTIISAPGTIGNTTVTNTDSRGHFIANAPNSTTRTFIRNGSIVTPSTQSQLGNGALVDRPLFISVINSLVGIYGYDNKECAFATIGDGLTDTDAANLYTIVQKYQTTLGRQV